MSDSRIVAWLERLIFSNRAVVIGVFVLVTLVMLYFSFQLRVDAGFTKLLPLEHEYMQTFVEYRQEFGSANRVLVALEAKQGDIFTAEFLQTLKEVTDELFFIPGVDRTQVRSLFTPNTRFTEVVEEGISGGNVVPNAFTPTPQGLVKLRENILKAGIIGRLVANDFSAAIVSAQLLEINPVTGKRLDYTEVARQLEDRIRNRFEDDAIDVHIIGFAKVVGDITEGARKVILFFVLAFFITALLVYVYSQSFRITLISLVCSLIAVIWQLGLLTLLGYGIDPMSILVPFLVFAIGVSHGVQMITVIGSEIMEGSDSLTSSRIGFRYILIPGAVALFSDSIGFITILFIQVEIIQEMATTASIGVTVLILSNLILLPVLLSYQKTDERYRYKLQQRSKRMQPIWNLVSRVAEPRIAAGVILISVGLLGVGLWYGNGIKIGDLHRGVPELRTDSQYNMDSQVISDKFSIGVDIISVIVEAFPEACIDYDAMAAIDRFEWYMKNVEGVQSVVALPSIAKRINAGWNEGSLKWYALPRNQSVLVQAVSSVPTSSGLLNNDCSVMPVLIFTDDHKAETIANIIAMVKQFDNSGGSDQLEFRLATGNVGVMAATNEEIREAQFSILIYVFCAIILLCLLTFRSIVVSLCIVIPLALVSLLAYALMSVLQIGLKVNTLPVLALGVGIGVDYGIYIYSRLSSMLAKEGVLRDAYFHTLATTGNGVVFTAITLATGVVTWVFSPLKFQADMGILLTFMFILNMLGAILLLPALLQWVLRNRFRHLTII